MADNGFVGGKLFTGRVDRKTARNAAEHLGDERLEVICRGQTVASPWLLSPIVTMFISKMRVIFVTDRNIHVFAGSIWRPAELKEKLATYPRGSVGAERTKLSITLEGQEKIFPMVTYGEAGDLVAAAASEGAAGGAPPPVGA